MYKKKLMSLKFIVHKNINIRMKNKKQYLQAFNQIISQLNRSHQKQTMKMDGKQHNDKIAHIKN